MFLPVAARGTLGDLRAFAIRRVARIAPAYYVSLAALIALWPLLTHGRDVIGPNPWEPLPLLWHVLFLQNEAAIGYPAYFPGFAVNPAIWTLSVEMIFYLVLALVAGAYLRRPWLGLAIGIAITVIWRIALDPPDDHVQNAFAPPDRHLIWKQFPLFAVDFAAGMTAAWVLVRLRRGPAELARRLATPVAALSLLLFLGLMVLVGMGTTRSRDLLVIAGAGFQEPLILAIAVPIVFAVFAVATDFLPARLSFPLTNPVSRWVGEVSYSVYLYHLIVIQLCVARFGFPTEGRFVDMLRLALVVLPVSLALGWISYVLVERPARRRAQKFTRRIRERAAARVSPSGAAALAAPRPGSRGAPPAGS
jgi:peptidoglycan/LPS O-acetylase OafA/YrhL